MSAARSPFLLDRHARLIRNLEEQAGLNRAVEHLPTEADLERRRQSGQGLTRPELAVLLAYSKNLVRAELQAADLPDDPTPVVSAYFPRAVQERFGARIRRHPLLREVAATQLASDLIDRAGPGFLYRLEERTGAGTPEVARAFAAVQAVFDLPWSAADGLPPAAEQAVLRDLQALTEHAAEELLHRGATGAAAARYRAPVEELAAASGDHARTVARTELLAAGVPGDVADRVAVLAALAPALVLADVAVDLGEPITAVARHHESVADALDLPWLLAQLATEPADTHWVQAAKAALREEVTEHWARFMRAAATGVAPAAPRFRAVVEELRAQRSVDIPMLTVAVRELGRAGDRSC